MKCRFPVSANGCKVPCGQCRACRQNRAREWAVRLIHELPYHRFSCFVTLTYDNITIPLDFALEKAECVRFLKRLRFNLSDREIRFYLCGEYGPKGTHRPHYHVALFGVGIDEHVLGPKIPGTDSWQCMAGPVNDAWQNGFVTIGELEWGSAMYVGKYVQKRLTGAKAAEQYGDMQPPFALMSKGLGARYCDEHAEQLRRNLFVSVNGQRMRLPRYYRERLKIDSEEVRKRFEEVHREEDLKTFQRYKERTGLRYGLWRKDFFVEFEEGPQMEHTLETRQELENRRSGL